MLIFSFPIYEHAPRVGMLCPHCWDLVPYRGLQVLSTVLLRATGNMFIQLIRYDIVQLYSE